MTYREVRPWAEAIKHEVLERRMPRWNAVKGFGEFKNDAGLAQEDLEIVGEWVDGGVPEGNPLYMPPPDFPADVNESHDGERHLAVSGTSVMKPGVEAIGIEPGMIPATGSLQAVARRPDGAIEPLLWVEKFNSKSNESYYFREPIHFPTGTKIEVTPKTASVVLIIK